MTKSASRKVAFAFEMESVIVPLIDILPLKVIKPAVRATRKFKQIVASINEVGLVEPPIVARHKEQAGKYLLVDGHVRLEILRERGDTEVMCLVSTDDEAYTYNKRISRLSVFQEHKMILKAIDRGVPEERIAKALNCDVGSLKTKIRVLKGICPEATELLKDKHIQMKAVSILRRVVPIRQIEMAGLMVAMNIFTSPYAEALLAATPQQQLVEPNKPRSLEGLSPSQLELMQRESANLDREFRLIEDSISPANMQLVLIKGYLSRLLENSIVSRFLSENHADIFYEFRRLSDDRHTSV